MRRRTFLSVLAGAAAAPGVARAQPAAPPVIGFLHSGTPEQNARRLAAFRRGLQDAGLVEGRSIVIEYRWAHGRSDRLPALAAELVRQQVVAIVTAGSTPATMAARAATRRIPIVFAIGADPVPLGLVASLSRPGGNATGLVSMNAELAAKSLGVVRELVPGARRHVAIVNPTSQLAEPFLRDLRGGAASLGLPLDTLAASSGPEIDALFAGLAGQPAPVLLFAPDSLFYVERARIAGLALRHRLPTLFDVRDYVEAGGLVSYGADWEPLMQQAGTYTARILRGETPADLPVVQAAKFELTVNLETARALGLAVPPTLLAMADAVIE